VRGLLVIAALLSACHRAAPPPRPGEPIRLVFRHMKMLGDPGVLGELFRKFEASHPGVVVVSEPLPSDSDLQHQLYVTNLEAHSNDFDLMTIDIVWVPEFAQAGWLLDLSAALPPARVTSEFLPGPARVVTFGGSTWAVPWFADVGLLYWRTDLLQKHGRAVPKTWTELAETTRFILSLENESRLLGYVWQGRQYEGIVCDVFEVIRGFGGARPGDAPDAFLHEHATLDALSFLRGLIVSGASPPQTTSADEETVRTLFNEGRAVFMRNWPYAWSLLEREGSPVRGKVAFGPLPAQTEGISAGTLGGWQIAVNRFVPEWKRQAAIDLALFLGSAETEAIVAHAYALQPARRKLYSDPKFLAASPMSVKLAPILEQAQPRPVTPYYLMMSTELQSQFSAAISGIRSPEEAMKRASRSIELLTGEAAR
jgi:multiple sugar transport system substrate-binding protein